MADNPFSNRTEFGIQNDALRYTWAAYNIFILLSSFIGDTTILVASIKYRALKVHKLIVVIVQQIAVCDLLMSAVFVFPRVVSLIVNKWVFGDTLGYIMAYGNYYFTTVGLLLIAVMTTTKLFILKYPIRAKFLSSQRSQMICVAMWILALIIPVIKVVVQKEDVRFDFRLYGCQFDLSANIWSWLKPTLACLFRSCSQSLL